MKKITMLGLTALLIFFITSTRPSPVSAQGMMGFFNTSTDNTAVQSQQQEEQEGQKFINDLKNQTSTCSQLTDADFEKIGEYFMGQSIGNTQKHIAMNDMMKRMMGEKGEEQAHQAMGKRLSGCNTTAAFPAQDNGFLPMMGMLGMMGGSNQWGGRTSGMMGNLFGNNVTNNNTSIFGIITWILVIIFLVVGIAYFLKGLSRKK
ncbi:hypothetical protein COY90_04200 [Candidatus Roizmanbacteria bacterium CG_4_10_14_0_8_um_filter_39_9]|uniref:Uncharacterized protein n=1 Tax=Candidatus Roizmanbacteria bacterium CG_4_10_14_0_8_um_filter_39_9 TaxID=1974829 RepID=A0A2M7QC13_9BACT|nr:MAG: hypothetical protein COY90_04200 [Candidatus Roizmanbacteria bacterium CG_4_10_14_0_8_um_filter_39_9]